MIQLNVDFTLLNKFFGIPASKIPQYANKGLEEIMELEAANGNTKAAEYKKILSDPDKILEIFKLADPENKLIILQNMAESDLDSLLPYLTSEQLSKGLNFFTEEKLMTLCQALPLEELIGMVFQKFDVFDVLQFMNDGAMNSFLDEPACERKYSQKYFESLDQKTLEDIMVYSFGAEFKGKRQREYLEHLENLEDGDYKRFLHSMERNSKMGLINGMIEQEADLLLLFKPEQIAQPLNMLMKDEKIKLMSSLDQEFLIPMIQELPMDLTQIVATQIDPKDFSEILARDFRDILASVVLFEKT